MDRQTVDADAQPKVSDNFGESQEFVLTFPWGARHAVIAAIRRQWTNPTGPLRSAEITYEITARHRDTCVFTRVLDTKTFLKDAGVLRRHEHGTDIIRPLVVTGEDTVTVTLRPERPHCLTCGKPYQAQSQNSDYCGGACGLRGRLR